MEPGRQVGRQAGVAVGLLAAQAVVQVGDDEVDGQPPRPLAAGDGVRPAAKMLEHVDEGDRVGPAARADDDRLGRLAGRLAPREEVVPDDRLPDAVDELVHGVGRGHCLPIIEEAARERNRFRAARTGRAVRPVRRAMSFRPSPDAGEPHRGERRNLAFPE